MKQTLILVFHTTQGVYSEVGVTCFFFRGHNDVMPSIGIEPDNFTHTNSGLKPTELRRLHKWY